MNKNLPYQRSDRISELIHHVLADALTTELNDPGLSGVSIQRVTITRDLGIARIYYSYSNHTLENEKNVEKAWQRASGYLRRVIGEKVELRIMPKLEFYYDKGMDSAERIEKLLRGENV